MLPSKRKGRRFTGVFHTIKENVEGHLPKTLAVLIHSSVAVGSVFIQGRLLLRFKKETPWLPESYCSPSTVPIPVVSPTSPGDTWAPVAGSNVRSVRGTDCRLDDARFL